MMKVFLGGVGVALTLLAMLWFVAPTSLLRDISFGGVVLDARSNILRVSLARDDKYRLYVPLEEIAPEVIKATLDYEDRYFYYHPGINPVSLLRGATSLISGRRQGGSTITMQVARMVGKLKTCCLSGKIRQIFLALALELRHSKQDILEAYFNLAPYGGNVEGIEAAARIYFHKGAVSLTALESRALALVPQNPISRHPVYGKDFQACRQRVYGESLPLKIFSQRQLPFSAPHLSLELGIPWRQVVTTIEPDLQWMLERRLYSFTSRYSRLGLTNGAAMLVRTADMAVVALAGSADFGNSAISGQIDGSRARRSPGSTLKPFIYALALDQGVIHPLTILADSPKSFGGYDPENFDHGFQGPVSARVALQSSRNLPAIALSEQLAAPGLYGFLQRAQVVLPHGPDYYGLALALGGAEVSMRELATLYACLANGGLWRPLRFVKETPLGAPRRLLSPEAAWLTIDMLWREEAMVSSRGRRMPYFYKTGTSNGFRDAWTVGITGDYVLLVWLGNFDNRSNPLLVGARTALPLFEEIVQSLAGQRPLRETTRTPPNHLNIVPTEICPATGDIYRGQCADPVSSYLIAGVSPVRDSGVYRKILVDRDTGLRTCVPENSEQVWHESWPSDMRQIFATAGIHKPELPDWSPACAHADPSGQAPRILLPKRNVVYYRRYRDSSFSVPLQGAADADARELHWYAGKNYIGSARPGETILWRPVAGDWDLLVVDDAGRSARQVCQVVTISE